MRQAIGCGYLPPVENARPWKHQGDDWGTDANGYPRGPTTCPAYTADLPDVIDIATARLHWEHGHLREYAGGEPCQVLMDGITILASAIGAHESWRARNPRKEPNSGTR